MQRAAADRQALIRGGGEVPGSRGGFGRCGSFILMTRMMQGAARGAGTQDEKMMAEPCQEGSKKKASTNKLGQAQQEGAGAGGAARAMRRAATTGPQRGNHGGGAGSALLLWAYSGTRSLQLAQPPLETPPNK